MECFLFYIDDWLSSKHVESMDAYEERGYLRLLLRAAKEDDCGLPDDDVQLAIFSKLGSQWDRPTKEKEYRIAGLTSGQKIRQCFISKPEHPGRLFNSRLLKEHEYQKSAAERRSKAGKAGSSARWASNKPDDNGMAKPCDSDGKRIAEALRSHWQNDSNHSLGLGFGFLSKQELETKNPDELWEFYWALFVAAGKALNDKDKEKTLRFWIGCEPAEHVRIVLDAQKRLSDGTWPNESKTAMPYNHLESAAWTRVASVRVIPTPPQSRGQPKRDIEAEFADL